MNTRMKVEFVSAHALVYAIGLSVVWLLVGLSMQTVAAFSATFIPGVVYSRWYLRRF